MAAVYTRRASRPPGAVTAVTPSKKKKRGADRGTSFPAGKRVDYTTFAFVVPRFLIRPVVPALMLWFAALLAVFLVADLFVMPWMAGRFRPVATVPLLRGLEPDAAADTLRARGLRFAIDTASDYSPRVPKGRVLGQMPDSGAVVKQGRRVWVRLSLGREPILRPARGP